MSYNFDNIAQYVIDHAVSADNVTFIKNVKNLDNNGFSNLIMDYSFVTVELDDKTKVELYVTEDSIYHDGAEISVIIHIDNKYFINYGRYNSWDASYFDDTWTEVKRIEKKVIKVTYEAL